MSLFGDGAQVATKLATRRLPSPGQGIFSTLYASGGDIAAKFSPAQALLSMGSYGSVGWLFAVVSRSAEAIAQVEWTTYRGQRQNRDELPTSNLLELFETPNPFYLRDDLLEVGAQHFLLVGEMNLLILKNSFGIPVELWPIRPDLLTPVPSRENYLAGYVYKDDNDYIPLAVDDVISIKRRDPIDPYRGRGVVQAIIADLQGERAAAKWNRNFFYNSAEPGGIVQFDHPISQTDFDKFLKNWNQNHGGVDNAHRVAVLTRGKWVERSISQRDMQFGELRKVNRDVILGAFGFPLPILGITENVNKANAEAATYHFTKWVVSPALRRIRNAVNRRLGPMFAPDITIDYYDPVPEDMKLALEMADKLWKDGIATKNEARLMVDLDVISGGDVYSDGTGTQKSYKNESGQWRCPDCNKRLNITKIQGLATVYCDRCRAEVEIESDELDPMISNKRRILA